ncbi:hypothetical protein QTP88_001273 [Uroleucon formosanum]
MERDDIIEISMSPFNAPLLLVKKKADASGKEKFRIVIDFRALNNVTINEFHPLPNITEILDQLGQSQLFSIVDLKSGYHQISLSKESRELTAFSTNQGHYHYKRMSMGLASAPSTFAKAMTNVMAGLIGHINSEHGIKPDPNKIVSVMNFPAPKNVKQIKSFLGLSGYYRKFINNYSSLANPIGWPLFLNSRIFNFSPPHFVHYYKKVIFVKFDHDCSPPSRAPKGLKNAK